MDETSTPFDEFEHSQGKRDASRPGRFATLMRGMLQGASFLGSLFAIVTAVVIVGLHIVRALAGTHHSTTPLDPLPTLKSAVPLIAIGASYLSLIFTVPRTAAQRFLGFLVALAFILWGAEQYMTNMVLISVIDDFVVLLFVFDLSLVIRENLKRSASEREGNPEVSKDTKKA